MSTRTKWTGIDRPDSDVARVAAEDEARISQFRELVFQLRTEAGLTQAELARRMATTQSAIARIEGGGARPSLDTLERLAAAERCETLLLIFGEGFSVPATDTPARWIESACRGAWWTVGALVPNQYPMIVRVRARPCARSDAR
jgi:transcriptional regulator with XRE-family HTH domain